MIVSEVTRKLLLLVAFMPFSRTTKYGAQAFSVLTSFISSQARPSLRVRLSSTSTPSTDVHHTNSNNMMIAIQDEEQLEEYYAENKKIDIDDDSQVDNLADNLSSMDTMEIKNNLLDLLPRMMGTQEEFKTVESYVNTLEERYTPVQTLDFLNLAMSGEWQLLFSTNLSGLPKSNFRLRELYQKVESNGFKGTISNQATWDLAENDNTLLSTAKFDASGTFTVKASYSINQGSRMVVDLNDHVLDLAKGSVVPKNIEGLVGLLHRAIPKELFDPSEHAMDTTYLDGDLRIVRMTGPRFEGVRDIFIRRGSMEVNPMVQDL